VCELECVFNYTGLRVKSAALTRVWCSVQSREKSVNDVQTGGRKGQIINGNN